MILSSFFLLTVFACDCDTDDLSQTEAVFECEYASFEVTIDKTLLKDMSERVKVSVTMTANEEISKTLGTSTFGREGIIIVRLSSSGDFGGDDDLYSSNYRVKMNAALIEVTLEPGERLTSALEFASYPFTSISGTEKRSPAGKYKVYIGISLSEMTDTGLYVIVK